MPLTECELLSRCTCGVRKGASGRSDLVGGPTPDVGDLARLVASKEGIRPARDNLDAAFLTHEVADVLWATFVIASRVGVDVPTAFTTGMADLAAWLAESGS